MPPVDDNALAHVRWCSPWFATMADRHPEWLDGLHAPRPWSAPETGFDAALRRYRNREQMGIIWRERAGGASTERTLADLTTLAETCLGAAVSHHQAALHDRFGIPSNAAGEPQPLVIIALGKLGGGELNLSSDVDIVLCYPEAGECDGRRGLPNETFFHRLARATIRSLSEVTVEGFCLRVDTRLRPFGQAGPLVASFAAMEHYYQREGRDWERYAWIKARPLAVDEDAAAAGQDLLALLRPFVYRRYIDYGAIESLRDMHETLQADARRTGRVDDIKRGPGGIREIEFLAQSFQLLRGGRDRNLQTASLLAALQAIADLELMTEEAVAEIRADYLFLRDVENAIQALHDEQIHSLPEGEDLDRLVAAVGEPDRGALQARLTAVRDRVRRRFGEAHPRAPEAPGTQAARERWHAIRSGEADETRWADFRENIGRRPLSQRAAERLDHFMPLLLERASASDVPPAALDGVLELVGAITRRSAYLSLLTHNPDTVDRLLHLFAVSPWVAQQVQRYPALLDELIDPALGAAHPERDEMEETSRRALRASDEPELQLNALNHVQRAFTLRIAVGEIQDTIDAVAAQHLLSQLAEVLLGPVISLGRSGGEDDLVIVAYGSLGARELAYDSDLDLVFLHADDRNEGMARLARRVLSMLTTLTPAGRLYPVDTRLRPNGRSGLLVSALGAFDRYQHENAWTWELQALTRARAVTGSPELAAAFDRSRADVLTRPRDPGALRGEVADMRRRMREEGDGGSRKGPKNQPGGLTDIGFLLQLGVLTRAADDPAVVEPTDMGGQAAALARSGWLTDADADRIVDAYGQLVRERHRAFLAGETARPLEGLEDVAALCRSRLGEEA